jgi:hypothetical protein
MSRMTHAIRHRDQARSIEAQMRVLAERTTASEKQ